VTIGDVVRVVLLFYLMPLWAVLLARLLLGERLTALAAVRVLLALAGAAVVLWPANGGWPWPRDLPDALGLIGGFCFALNNVLLRREAHRPEMARALAMFLGGCVVAGTLAAVLAGQGAVPLWPAASWPLAGTALALGLIFLLGNLALQYGAARLSANATAVVMLSEVLFASASAVWLGAGHVSVPLVLGGALIVSAALLATRRG
jgi:drug/metabolite transporter (DMT)-like permease